MKNENKKTGPKPMTPRADTRPLYLRDIPNDLRNKAKSKAAGLGISLREFAIQALTEKVGAKH